MEIDQTSQGMVEDVSISEILGLASWDRPRTSEQLEDFISRREAEVLELID